MTTDAIHFEQGTLSTTAETVPLYSVVDVDLKQSVSQKARGLGDVIIHLDGSAHRFGQRQISLQSIRDFRQVRELLVHHSNGARQDLAVRRHQLAEQEHQRSVEQNQAGATQFGIQNLVPTSSNPSVDATTPSVGSVPASPPSMVAAELKQLAELRDAGILTDEEFSAQKQKLLG